MRVEPFQFERTVVVVETLPANCFTIVRPVTTVATCGSTSDKRKSYGRCRSSKVMCLGAVAVLRFALRQHLTQRWSVCH